MLFLYASPQFINHGLMEDHRMPLCDLLQDEATGMAFPVDARFFDDYPLITEGLDVAAI